MIQSLTPKQRIVLEFLIDFKKFNGIMPSLQEIAEGVKDKIGYQNQRSSELPSKNTIRALLNQLEAKGYVEIEPGVARGIEVKRSVTSAVFDVIQEIEKVWEQENKKFISEEQAKDMIRKILKSYTDTIN